MQKIQKLLTKIILLFATSETVKKWNSFTLKVFLFYVGLISFIILIAFWLHEDIWEQYPDIRLEETSCSTWLKLKNDDCE